TQARARAVRAQDSPGAQLEAVSRRAEARAREQAETEMRAAVLEALPGTKTAALQREYEAADLDTVRSAREPLRQRRRASRQGPAALAHVTPAREPAPARARSGAASARRQPRGLPSEAVLGLVLLVFGIA